MLNKLEASNSYFQPDTKSDNLVHSCHLPSACLYVVSLSNRLETWNQGVCTIILTPVCTTLHIQAAGQWGGDLLPCLSCAERALGTPLVLLLPVPYKPWTILLSFGCSIIINKNV